MPFALAKLQRARPLTRTLLAGPVIDQALQNVANLDIAALRYKADWTRQDFVAVADYLNSRIDTSSAVIVVEDLAPPSASGGGDDLPVLRASTDPLMMVGGRSVQ